MNQTIVIGDNSGDARMLRKFELDVTLVHHRVGERVPNDPYNRVVSEAWDLGDGDVVLLYRNVLVLHGHASASEPCPTLLICLDDSGRAPYRESTAAQPPLCGEYVVVDVSTGDAKRANRVVTLADGDVEVYV